MEAHGDRSARGLGGIAASSWDASRSSAGPRFAPRNFVVEAPTPSIARTVAEHAETCRVEHRQGLAGPRAADLDHSLPDPGEADIAARPAA